jgi:hypothetical protein
MSTAAEPIKVNMPALYTKQRRAIFSPARYSVIEASTKAGKTLGCIVWQAYRVMSDGKAREHWWVAPVYPQSNIAYRRAKKMFRGLCKTNDNDMYLTFDNGARWVFKSGEKPDNLYGEDVADAVLDEFTRLREESWHAVRSTLTATRGPVRFIGNVKGRGNWGYRIARMAEDESNANYEYHKIIAWDAVEAGVLDRAEIEDAQGALPDNVFRELYLCEPSDDGGNPFGIDAIRACKIARQSVGAPVAYGVDLAKSHDWTWVYGIDDQGREVHSERWQGSWGDTRKRILAIVGDKPALIDSTGVGDPIVEDLIAVRKNIQGFKFTSQSKQQIMEGLAVAIQQGKAGIADDKAIAELEVFEYEYTRTGVRYTAPAGLHDDGVCAMALAHECKRAYMPQTIYIGGSMLDNDPAPVGDWFDDDDTEDRW